MDALLIVLGLLTLVLLTAGTFVCVAGEFSLSALERSTVDAHVDSVGDRRAHSVKRAHRTLSFQLSGAQVGITLSTIVTGFVAEPALAPLLRPAVDGAGLDGSAARAVTLGVALILSTGLSMVFGEMVPKNFAIARALPTARQVAPALAGFSSVFRWLINATNNSANWIVRRLGIEPVEELRSARSPQELGSLVRSSAEQGTLDAGTATLLDRSLRFGDRTAEDLMTPRVQVEALRADATVIDLLDSARQTGFSRFPVYGSDLDDVLGVVHIKQAFAVPADDRVATRLDALCRPVPTVPESLASDVLLDRLRGKGLQVAIVVDEYGGTAGIATLEDLVEEIVGDVRDEHDMAELPQVRPLGTASWVISGLLRDDEVADATGFVMPEGDYETVAGLVLERLGRIPDIGDGIVVDGWELSVLRMDRHRIADIRLTAPREGAAEPSPERDES